MAMPEEMKEKLLSRVEDELKRPAAPPAFLQRGEASSRPQPLPAPPSMAEETARPATVTAFAPRRVRDINNIPPLPEYVKHDPSATYAAQLASHSIIAEFERTAQDVEAAGMEFHAKAVAVLEYMQETAHQLREMGAEAFSRIQEMSKLAGDVLDKNTQIRDHIASPPKEKTDAEVAAESQD